MGASYQSSYWDETLHLSNLDQLNEELEETVRSVLLDGDVDLAPIRGNGPHIPDAYFGANVTEDVEQVTELEISEIRHEQENVVIRYLANGGFSQVEQECLHTLVTDGGDLSPQTIADKIDRHVDSVRRALKRKSELFEREYGKTALKSDYVAELVHELLIGAQEQYERALSTTAKAIGAKKQGLSESKIQWVAWCERYDVDISNRYDALEIDFGNLDPDYDPDPRFLVREGLRVWKSAGQDPARYRTASVKYNGVRRQVFQLL